MNLEAISGIKQTSNACALVRNEAIKLTQARASLSAINAKLGQIIKSTGAESCIFKNNGHWHVNFGINQELISKNPTEGIINESDIIKILISLKLNGWIAHCSTTVTGNDSKLINSNRSAVLDTCESLCPGLPAQDITTALKLSHEEFNYTQTFTNSLDLEPTPTSKQRLKAGDILSINCLSTIQKEVFRPAHSDRFKLNSLCAFHEETILITANGAEILTRK